MVREKVRTQEHLHSIMERLASSSGHPAAFTSTQIGALHELLSGMIEKSLTAFGGAMVEVVEDMKTQMAEMEMRVNNFEPRTQVAKLSAVLAEVKTGEVGPFLLGAEATEVTDDECVATFPGESAATMKRSSSWLRRKRKRRHIASSCHARELLLRARTKELFSEALGGEAGFLVGLSLEQRVSNLEICVTTGTSTCQAEPYSDWEWGHFQSAGGSTDWCAPQTWEWLQSGLEVVPPLPVDSVKVAAASPAVESHDSSLCQGDLRCLPAPAWASIHS
jgi:hypothetical protein